MKCCSKRNLEFANIKYLCEQICFLIMSLIILEGCSGNSKTAGDVEKEQASVKICLFSAKEDLCKGLLEKRGCLERNPVLPEETQNFGENMMAELEIMEMDWSSYFDGLNGAAVVYVPSKKQYMIYNTDQALIRRSPCSTFKIISSLIALENGIVEPDNSIHTWSGEIFWNENWNRDIDFAEAFRTSCVWYFREVIDETGSRLIQAELNNLQYGNCDISDWEGRLNTNNNNRALNGFWLESSLKISPKEQAEVMERIFGETSVYSEEAKSELKQVMLVTDQDKTGFPIYGKTGMGKDKGAVVDAWFTGFAEGREENIYFCVYLGRTDDKDVSSGAAKEIAIAILKDLVL